MYDAHERNGESVPFWQIQRASRSAEAPHTRTDPLGGPAPDVLVIGAGIAGLSVAYHLLRAGSSVLVVDKASIAAGETGRSTAHLADALDDRYHLLERAHGEEGAALAAQSHRAAIESIFEIAQRESITCELERVDGYLFSYADESPQEIEREFAAAQRARLQVELIASAPTPFQTGPSLRFANQGQLDPRAYTLGLADAVQRLGGRICTGAHVVSVESEDPPRVRLADGTSLSAANLVVATNTPIHDTFAMHTKQAPYRSYVVGVGVPNTLLPRALFWDTRDPYHYLRWTGDDLLLVGGEDHRVGQESNPVKRWLKLEEWVRSRIPSVGEVRTCWSGQVLEPMDGLAFIGKNPGSSKHSYIVTGDSGNGITHGALAGILLCDLIQGRANAWTKVYDPARKPKSLSAVREYFKENAQVAKGYASWLKPSPSKQAPPKPGHGALVQRGLSKVALYVDEAGAHHECSAVCPHLAGIVAWNDAERSWDCTCHGSRFDPYGKVMTGPARNDLARVDDSHRPARTTVSNEGFRSSTSVAAGSSPEASSLLRELQTEET